MPTRAVPERKVTRTTDAHSAITLRMPIPFVEDSKTLALYQRHSGGSTLPGGSPSAGNR